MIHQGNLLWVDLDFADAEALICEVLEPLGLAPTLVVFSGRGFWFFWKLREPVAKGMIEPTNGRLASLLGGDRCTDCTRIARVPGSINTKHAHRPRVEVRSLEWNRRYLIEDFALALPDAGDGAPAERFARASGDQAFDPEDRVEGIQWSEPDWLGRPDLVSYVFGGKHEGDRSRIEAQVAAKLLSSGWCRGEVHAFFRKYGLPRYLLDQKAGRAHNLDRWIDRVIREKSKSWDLGKLNPPLNPPSVHRRSAHSPVGTGLSLNRFDRRRTCVDMARGQTLAEFSKEVCEVTGRPKSTIRRDLSILTYGEGPLVYACDLQDPNHRRKRIYRNEAVAEKVDGSSFVGRWYLDSARTKAPHLGSVKRGGAG